jgi:hypothetical protein
MKQVKRISMANEAPRLPLTFTVAWWLLLDRLQPPGWVWGASGVVIVLLWVMGALAIWQFEPVDVLKELRDLRALIAEHVDRRSSGRNQT